MKIRPKLQPKNKNKPKKAEELELTLKLQNRDIQWFREQLAEAKEQRDDWFHKATTEDKSQAFWMGTAIALAIALIVTLVAHNIHGP